MEMKRKHLPSRLSHFARKARPSFEVRSELLKNTALRIVISVSALQTKKFLFSRISLLKIIQLKPN